IKKALAGFKGIQRRFERIIDSKDLVFIDDYAHHPGELRVAIDAARTLYPDRKITGIFQPHLYSRTRDFSEAFAASLSMLDYAYVMDVYPARELPIPGVTSKLIVDKIVQPKALVSEIDLFDLLKNTDFHILISIGAGNIIDLKEKFIKIIYDKHLNS
ncbi:MAG: UDP-N-acetylmuramate--L-alanine ligase, partial [Chitinophagales bacterium]|nr:UDP-N-acetylmuramate--L-alanine ligase [Chitinophagales bacterium]